MTSKKNPNLVSALIGRDDEIAKVRACLLANRNVLLEGPVGVGKTHLALAVAEAFGGATYRVDGDSRYSEQKLTGWFDPPMVMKRGFVDEAFMPGPLVEAMSKGGILFINELNRLPEGVQNVLLPAIDERMIVLPKLGIVRAKPGFKVIATQNPKEFVATSHLSEAILDRFELVMLEYQSENDEVAIVQSRLETRGLEAGQKAALSLAAVRVARMTRDHSRVRRGASIRAAMSVSEICSVLISQGQPLREAFLEAVLMALPTRIEIERDADPSGGSELQELLREWAQTALDDAGVPAGKKKPR